MNRSNISIGNFTKYFVSGGIAAIVEILSFKLLMHFSNVMTSGLISFLIALIVNYVISSNYVFRKEISILYFVRFSAGAWVGFLINMSALYVFSVELGIFPIYSKILAIGMAFVFNFLINAIFVFRGN